MKTLVVTGGGRGLGRVTAGKLARAGHHVVLVARTHAAAEGAAAQIRTNNPATDVESRVADLASLASIRTFAAAIAAGVDGIDVLFNIAGVLQTSRSRRVTADVSRKPSPSTRWHRYCSPGYCSRRSSGRAPPGWST